MAHKGSQPYATYSNEILYLGQGDNRYGQLTKKNYWQQPQEIPQATVSAEGINLGQADGRYGRLATDNVWQGKQTMAQALVYLTENSRSFGDLPAHYPEGYSVMELSNLGSGTSWPDQNGYVVTFNYGNGGAVQTFYEAYLGSNSNYTVKSWFRIIQPSGTYWQPFQEVWSSGNQGSGSGLDADTLDGYNSTFYTNIIARLGYTPANTAGDNFTGGVIFTGDGQVSSSAVIAVALGDSDTGFHWISDGHFEIYSNNTNKASVTPSGFNFTDDPTVNGRTVWNAGNDGPGSGLNADFLDGQQGSFYQNAYNLNAGIVPTGRLSGTYNINISGNASTANNANYSNTSGNANNLGGLAPSYYSPKLFTNFREVSWARSYNTTYHNSTGKPMLVTVSPPTDGNRVFFRLYINGQAVVRGHDEGNDEGWPLTAIVPAGASYHFTGDGVTIAKWLEVF